MLDDLVTFCRDKGEQDIMLTVDVTPDGHGDAIRTVKSRDGIQKCMFVKPQEQEMSIIEFRNRLRLKRRRESSRRHLETDETGKAIYPLKKPSDFQPNDENTTHIDTKDTSAHFHFEQVLYYSRQNDCLRTELRPLFDSGMFPETINFAQEVFGTSPDAVNLWIGNKQAVSSMHKDHYENLFYVLSGEKIFVLCPPADAPFLYQAEFDSGTFQQKKSGEWIVKENDGDSQVKWIQGNVEPLVDNKDAVPTNQPLLSLTHPIRVHVKAGEMLYLPALWFHQVAQTCETVGINYWYDMQFDSPNWCYFNLLQQLQVVDSTKTDSIEP
jgi:jumonji domain-containing protein 7